MKSLNSGIAGLGTTIFETMSRAAVSHGAVNLGQGFPEGLEPPALIEAATRALAEGGHQYPSMLGLPALRQALAAHDRRFFGLDLDWDREILVTSGATEALACAFLALIEPGDEVIVLEPAYDSYVPVIRRGGGVPRLVRLNPPDWSLPRAELAAAFGPRTKAIVVNNPHNPLGKVFSADELAFIADLVVRHDCYVICDEVYDHLVLDGQHQPLLGLPALRDRAVRIGSAGKTFSVTGWKVGYISAAPALAGPLAKAHQYLTFTTPPALQAAVAEGLGWDDTYYTSLTQTLRSRRQILTDGLIRAGFTVLPCQGTYFLIADYRALSDQGDLDFCHHLVETAGVAAVPLSAFYAQAPAQPLIRFCFAKTEAVITEAVTRLTRWASRR